MVRPTLFAWNKAHRESFCRGLPTIPIVTITRPRREGEGKHSKKVHCLCSSGSSTGNEDILLNVYEDNMCGGPAVVTLDCNA